MPFHYGSSEHSRMPRCGIGKLNTRQTSSNRPPIWNRLRALQENIGSMKIQARDQTPKIRGSNPYIGKIFSTNCSIEKMKIKNKRPGMAHLKKKMIIIGRHLHSK